MKQDSRIAAAIRLITGSPARRWTVAELATAVDLSPSYLRHLFVISVGMTPKKYLKLEQLRKAEELLRTSTLQIKTVMHEAGFSDPSHFARDFAKQFGASPNCYRERVARRSRAGDPAHTKSIWPIARGR
jgi:AraC family transcriptional regulator